MAQWKISTFRKKIFGSIPGAEIISKKMSGSIEEAIAAKVQLIAALDAELEPLRMAVAAVNKSKRTALAQLKALQDQRAKLAESIEGDNRYAGKLAAVGERRRQRKEEAAAAAEDRVIRENERNMEMEDQERQAMLDYYQHMAEERVAEEEEATKEEEVKVEPEFDFS